MYMYGMFNDKGQLKSWQDHPSHCVSTFLECVVLAISVIITTVHVLYMHVV